MRQVALDLCSRPLVDARLGVDALREESFADRLLAGLGRLLVDRQEYGGLHGRAGDGGPVEEGQERAQIEGTRLQVAGAGSRGRVEDGGRAEGGDGRGGDRDEGV